ncbi:MAG: hypothetical protein QOJ76_135 [Acidobacteriota bacterium]|jgi:hypothetical protein|nr:hypothetical protein [Acidobacteriota bacterium]
MSRSDDDEARAESFVVAVKERGKIVAPRARVLC